MEVKYSEVIEETISEIFDSREINFSELNIKEYKVDIEEIAKIYDYKIVYKNLDKKTESSHDVNKKTIYIKTSNNKDIQRFNIAKELAYILLFEDIGEYLSNRDRKNIDSISNIVTENIARKLLLPDRLLYMLTDELIENKKQEVSDSMKRKYIKQIAETTEVPKEVVIYKLEEIEFNWNMSAKEYNLSLKDL